MFSKEEKFEMIQKLDKINMTIGYIKDELKDDDTCENLLSGNIERLTIEAGELLDYLNNINKK